MKTQIYVAFLLPMLLIASDCYSQRTKKSRKREAQQNAIIVPQNNTLGRGGIETQQPNVTLGGQGQATASRTVGDFERVFEQIRANSTPIVENRANGSINWTEQFIEAVGQSAIDFDRFPNQAQARLMAQRGAIVVAQRNLLEIIQGVNITGETTVQDMITTSDFIYTRVDGVIKGAQQVGEFIERDGIVSVRMRVPLYESNGLAPALYDELPQVKMARTTRATANSGNQDLPENLFAFNLNGKKINPSMFPIIVDENNNVLLDMTRIYDPRTGKFPQYVNASREIMQALGFEKGIQWLDVINTHSGRIQVTNESSRKINWDRILNTASRIYSALRILPFIP